MSFIISSPALQDIDVENLKSLFRSCKWDWLEPDSEMIAALAGAFKIYVVKFDNQTIGFARIVSDGKIYGFLVDCMVSPGFRRKGVGKQLVDFVVHDCQAQGLKVIQLLASRDGFPLYQKAGFTKCPESSPGMIKFLVQPH